MTIANELIAVLNKAKSNEIDVQIKELPNGLIGCTCTCIGSDYTEVSSLESLIRHLKSIVEDWRII